MTDSIIFPGLGGLSLEPARGFTIPGTTFTIYYYGVIIALGLVLSVLYGLRRSKEFGLKQDDIIDGILWIVPLAIICTRAYYVLSEWDQYKGDFVKMINIRDGGLAIFGGVIGAAGGVVIFSKVKKVSLPAVLDLVAVSFLIGQAIGRWGNFINREAFGSYTDSFLAMQIPMKYLGAGTGEAFDKLRQMAVEINGVSYIQVHPTFLYESLWNVAGFVLLHFLSKKRQYDGQVALGYAAWYGLGRAFIEGLRMDSLYWGPFRGSQLLAAVICFASVVVLMIMSLKKHDRANLYVNRLAAMEAEAALPAEEETEETTVEEYTEETEETTVEEYTEETEEME